MYHSRRRLNCVFLLVARLFEWSVTISRSSLSDLHIKQSRENLLGNLKIETEMLEETEIYIISCNAFD